MAEPEEPAEDDCCHNGCVPCVFDIYKQKLDLWHKNELTKYKLNYRYDLLSDTRFKPYKLNFVRVLTCDTNLYTLQALCDNEENPEGLLPVQPGQHLVIRLNSDDKKKSECLTVRSYTYIPDDEINVKCQFNVLVKLYDNGLMSQYFRKLNVGDVTYWRGPYGHFNYKRNKYLHLLMICMGTGIAPMYALSKGIVHDDLEETIVTLLYGCKSPTDIILRDEIMKLTSFWNFNCKYFLSQLYDEERKRHAEVFVKGRITANHISLSLKSNGSDMALICGSDGFCDSIKTILINNGLTENNIFIF